MGEGDRDRLLGGGLRRDVGSGLPEVLTRLRAVFGASLACAFENPGWSIWDIDEGNGTPSWERFEGN